MARKTSKIVTPKDVKENIISLDYAEEMKQSYLDYAVSVLGERALADVRDGLKPVQRRILYSMDELGLGPNTAFKKSARIVGDAMGKYHPHGDCLDKDTLVPLLNGEFKTIEELYEDGQDVYVLSIDPETNEIVPAIAHDFRIGQYSKKIYKIKLSTGEVIKATSNHPFRLPNGEWVKTENLKSNMILDGVYFTNRKWEPITIGREKMFTNDCDFHDAMIPIVQEIQVEELMEEIPMYDFTVDNFSNMLICANKECTMFVVAHNSSIYGGLVTMSKDWLFQYPLVEGHGNFGSIEGDGAAAMRYTEARLSQITKKYFFEDLKNDTVDFVPNFDETEKEPKLLPVRIPNLLISGSEGIACGMAASIPSHNAGEVIDAVLAYMKNEKISIDGLMQYIKGPDFATGGIISNASSLSEIYKTGCGKVRVRGKVSFEEENGHPRIVITEIPQTMVGSIDKFMESVADLVRDKKLTDVVDIANMSNKNGIRIVIELKKGSNPQKVANILYKKTKLEDTYGVTLLAVKDFVPHVYNLKEYIEEFVKYQYEINTRKYRYLHNRDEKILEVKRGLLKACDCIDLIIEIIRGSKTKQMAKDCLINGKTDQISFKTAKSKKDASKLKFSEPQANAILSMQLSSLIGLEIAALKKEIDTLSKKKAEYEGYLTSEVKMKHRIEADLKEAQKDLNSSRRTELIDAEEIVLEKEEVVVEDCAVLIDRFGYVKSIGMDTYERNKEACEKEYKYVFITNTADKIFIFSDSGNKYQIKIMDIPLGKFKDKGQPFETLSKLTTKENILLISLESIVVKKKMLFLTEEGFCKKVPGSEFICSNKTSVATKFKTQSDKLSCVSFIEKGDKEAVIFTDKEQALRFDLKEIPEMKKNSVGVRGLKIKSNDKAISIYSGTPDTKINKVIFSDIKKQKRDTQPSSIYK